jgi:hypothetical protein
MRRAVKKMVQHAVAMALMTWKEEAARSRMLRSKTRKVWWLSLSLSPSLLTNFPVKIRGSGVWGWEIYVHVYVCVRKCVRALAVARTVSWLYDGGGGGGVAAAATWVCCCW